MITHEQRWDERKTVRTDRGEITVGTEHWRSDEWRNKGRVTGAKLRPDLVWLRRDPEGIWRKVVVDVKVTSTEKMNESFNEKDDKYRIWATSETREKKVAKAVMVPLIISHDGAVHRDTVRRWKDFAPDINIDWVRMAQNVLRYNVLIVGSSSTKAAGSPSRGRKSTLKNMKMSPKDLPGECLQPRNEERG